MKHKQNKEVPAGSEARQVGRFGLVGVFNTVVDFTIYNLLTSFAAVPAALAAVLSGTVAMINSFVFNQRYTFRTKHVHGAQVVAFFVITGFGQYVIRPLIITALTENWLWPAHFAQHVVHFLRLPLSDVFISNNLALAIAIILILAYNYLMYKKFVFVK